VVGASAGGVEALRHLVGNLPGRLPASVLVVLHLSPASPSALPKILDRAGPLPAHQAVEGERLEPGRIYVAPPDRHLLLNDGVIQLTQGPRENGHRPAVDTLFRSAARWHDGRVVGVVLSGALDDGTAGLAAVKARGGVAVVQDPHEALYRGMPVHAIENVSVDHVLTAAGIAELLVELAGQPPPPSSDDPPALMTYETDIAELEMDAMNANPPGTPSGFTCPDCSGTLWELHEGQLVRFRCRVGHAWSADSLLAQQSAGLEAALWAALRALEEKASLARRMAARARERGHQVSASRFAEQARDASGRAAVVRDALAAADPAEDIDLTAEQAS
jgi:two-component system chemotaxis response regulator CheB